VDISGRILQRRQGPRSMTTTGANPPNTGGR
jgi:hypothetical protein